MLHREVHLLKLTNVDMRGSVEGQIKELIMEMTYKQPDKRINIDAVYLKLEGYYYRSDFTRTFSMIDIRCIINIHFYYLFTIK